MRILVCAASRHGGTAEIARRLADALRREGAEVAVIRPEEVAGVSDYDAVVLGSGVYLGRWLPAARRMAARFEEQLRRKPVWLFSSGPVGPKAAEPDPRPVNAERLIERTGAIEHQVFGGRIERARLSRPERFVVARLHVPDGDDRDWARIESWGRAIVEQANRIRADAR